MDRYEAKESYVIKRNNENRAKLDGVLTEDQINAIESLCSFRHRLHISAEKLYLDEYSDASFYTEEISEYGDDIEGTQRYTIQKLFGVYPFDRIEYFTEIDEDLNEENMSRDDMESENLDRIEKLNDQIEEFLKNIDDKYGTDYCPTGKAREKFYS